MKIIIILLMATTLFSCVNRVDKMGYVFENIDFEDIKKGVTSKDTILKNCGNPTLVGEINDKELWIYYSEEIKHFLYFKPKVIDRKVVMIDFNEEGRVNEVKKLDLSDEDTKFSFDSHKTFVQSHNVNFFKAIYDNVGSIRPQ